MSPKNTPHARHTARRSKVPKQEPGAALPVMRAVKPREYGSTKAVVGEAFAQAGGAKEVEAIFDLSSTQIYGFTDPDAKGCDLSLHRARQLAYVSKIETFAVDFAGLAGGAFLSRAALQSAEAITDIGADISQTTAEVVSDLFKAVQDGNLDQRECSAILQRCDGALAAILSLRGRAMQGCKP